jgi:transcriptional regulator with XRE-family HTH domain
MYSRPNAASLAARIRSLVGLTDRDALRRLACDLGVHDGELREILEYHTPYPSTSVLAAIVAAYGVDAGWLLTGEYSPSTHRAEEEADEPPKSRVTRSLGDLRSPGSPR